MTYRAMIRNLGAATRRAAAAAFLVAPASAFLVALVVALAMRAGPAAAQGEPTLGPDDYGRWERLGGATLSPDGLWVAVSIGRVNDEDELRVHRTDSDSVVVVPFGASPSFSRDSRWLAHAIEVSPDEREALERRDQPVRDAMGLLDLRTGQQERMEAVASFSFSPDGAYLAIRRYAPEERESESEGVDVIVRDLSSGSQLSFGNVSELAWQDEGQLLAMVIDTDDRVGNGVKLYDPASGRFRSLDAEAARYRGLSWREESADLAALKTFPDEAHEDTAHVALAWRGLDREQPTKSVLDPRESASFPSAMRVVEHRAPTWSEDGGTVFLGLQERRPVEPRAATEDAAPDEREAGPDDEDEDGEDEADGGEEEEDDEDDVPGVEIWHSRDVDPVPWQRVRERELRRENHLAAWHLDDNGLVQLGDDLTEEASVVEGGAYALGRDGTPYEVDGMFRQEFADLYAIDAKSGAKRLVASRIERAYGGSPEGRYLLWLEGDHFWTYDLREGAKRNITRDVPARFVNHDQTPTREQMPPYGVAGWLEGDGAVLLYDDFDVWEVRADGSGGRALTRGVADSIRYRVIRVDDDAEAFDPDEPIYYSTYGEWTKKAGYARAAPGDEPRMLVWRDASLGFGLERAEDAPVLAYRAERFEDSPDYFVAGPDLADARQVTRTNPFQDEYAWGRAELVEYENEWGRRLQGALFYPADYEPGRTYPMIVYHYELLSRTLHQYQVPDPTSTYNGQIWSQEGYFVLRPDVVYRDRRPGQSNVETIRPAVAAALATGMIDEERMGLIGHSWGGYQTAFYVTQDDMFAAAVAGAPLTNLMSMYLSFYWNSGSTDARIFEISQGRMQVPWWEDWDSYHANSPVHHIQNLNTPLLVEFGTNDGAVEFNQGVEFYNAARRAGKDLVMLVYEGENHGLAEEPNQRDYQGRILQWFGHYLKGEPAPDWISTGVPLIQQKDGLKKKPIT